VPPNTQLTWRGFVGFLALFAGLCTVFALIVTVAEGWQEHAQAQWPETTARVENCYLHETSADRREHYYIDCRLSYVVGDHEFVAKVFSRNAPSRSVWQYPPNQIGPLEDWVEAHPPGTPITLQYNPGNPKKAVLAATTDMPLGGPRTPNNLKLLGIAGVSCVVLLGIGWVARPQSGTASAETAGGSKGLIED
jgi:Protein of unknown function (DUF3592)